MRSNMEIGEFPLQLDGAYNIVFFAVKYESRKRTQLLPGERSEVPS